MNTDPGYYRHGCTGPCNQGDMPCPCPEACRRPVDNDPHAGFGVVVWPLASLVAVLAVCVLSGVLA
jgi:hypothetical protein